MEQPKFKIGDTVDTAWGTRRKIVDIVLEKRVVRGNWIGGNNESTCIYCYVLHNVEAGTLTMIDILKQNEFTLVSSETESVVSSCPTCKRQE
jgi:hypothetical protein